MKKTISLVLCAVFAVAFYTYAAAMPERSPRVLMTEDDGFVGKQHKKSTPY